MSVVSVVSMATDTSVSGGGFLRKINSNIRRLEVIEPGSGVTMVNKKSDFGVFSGGKATLITGQHYILNKPVDISPDVLEGINFNITGDLTFQTILTTNSPLPLISSTGPGYIQLVDVLAVNGGGPLLDATLGSVVNVSILYLDRVRFSGVPLPGAQFRSAGGPGIGSLGKVDGADQVFLNNCFFLDLSDGLELDGSIRDVSIINTTFASNVGATAFTGLKILAAASMDIAVFDEMRFSTFQAADRGINFSPSAAYASPVRLNASTIRGPGTFIDATSLQKTSPKLITLGNGGVTAPTDSKYVGNAVFKGNTDETVIADPGVQVPIGNGTPGHTLFDGDAFVERFTLTGAETQLQVFTYTGEHIRTFKVEIHAELTRVGGGTVLVELGIKHDGVVIPSSEVETDVGNRATLGYTAATVELEPGCTISLVIANNSTDANLIVNSARWEIHET